MLGLIDEMAEDGKTVVMCTHLLLEAEGLADQVVVMDHGRAVVAGSPAELTHRYWPAGARPRSTPTIRRCSTSRVIFRTSARTNATESRSSTSNDSASVPELVDTLVADGARLRRVEPRAPSLEELYFAIRNEHRAQEPAS